MRAMMMNVIISQKVGARAHYQLAVKAGNCGANLKLRAIHRNTRRPTVRCEVANRAIALNRRRITAGDA